MVSNFFEAKRPWSRYKDYLLRSYIEPYIPKVASLKRPILIVDCFAGRGRFDDGEPGSPLIIAEAIERWRSKGVDVTGECIEADSENFHALCDVLRPHKDYCTPREGVFDDHLPELARRAQRNTVFLYVDPYMVKGLVFQHMKRVYDRMALPWFTACRKERGRLGLGVSAVVSVRILERANREPGRSREFLIPATASERISVLW